MNNPRPTKLRRGLIGPAAAAGLGLLAALGATPSRADEFERTYWSMIVSKQDVEVFETYLKRYPDGEHAEEARQRIAELSGTAAPANAGSGAGAPTPAPAPAEALLEQAVAAQSKGDYPTAAMLYSQAAEAGSGDAHMHLGFLYEFGEGVAQNSEEALRHYQAAGDLGNPDGHVAAIYLMAADQPARAADLVLALARKDPARAAGVLDTVTQATLTELQRRLAANGLYASAIDGVTGPGTRAALAAYAAMGTASPPAAGGGLVVSHTGIGGVTSRTAYEADALRQALPGLEIETRRISAEGMSEMVFIARKDGGDVMRIEGMDGRVSAIRISGAGIADERGMTIGRSGFTDFKGDIGRDCSVREDREGATLLCQSEDEAIMYFFTSPMPVFLNADGSIRLNTLPATAPLTGMLWYPLD